VVAPFFTQHYLNSALGFQVGKLCDSADRALQADKGRITIFVALEQAASYKLIFEVIFPKIVDRPTKPLFQIHLWPPI
jgi:hypothetical protein